MTEPIKIEAEQKSRVFSALSVAKRGTLSFEESMQVYRVTEDELATYQPIWTKLTGL